jgi:hypothetical protein
MAKRAISRPMFFLSQVAILVFRLNSYKARWGAVSHEILENGFLPKGV